MILKWSRTEMYRKNNDVQDQTLRVVKQDIFAHTELKDVQGIDFQIPLQRLSNYSLKQSNHSQSEWLFQSTGQE